MTGDEPAKAHLQDLLDTPPAIIDTREQAWWGLAGWKITRACLKTGDYSIVGMEDTVAIERKSLSDLVGSLTKGRERFMREMQRMSSYKVKCIIVEASLADLMAHSYRSMVNPTTIWHSLLAIHVDCGVPTIFCNDRVSAEATARFILLRAWKNRVALGLVAA